MLGLTRCERSIAIALPFIFLSSALLIGLSSTAWTIYGRPIACTTPPHFTSSWLAYVHEVCCSRISSIHLQQTILEEDAQEQGQPMRINDRVLGPGEWAAHLPARLLLSALILTMPLLLGDVMDRLAEAVAPGQRSLSRTGTAVRTTMILLIRAAMIICLLMALRKTVTDPLKIDDVILDKFPTDQQSGTRVISAMCTYGMNLLEQRQQSFTSACSYRQGPHVGLAQMLWGFLRYVLVVVMVWVSFSTAVLIGLVACPSTRSATLKDTTQAVVSVEAAEDQNQESKL